MFEFTFRVMQYWHMNEQISLPRIWGFALARNDNILNLLLSRWDYLRDEERSNAAPDTG